MRDGALRLRSCVKKKQDTSAQTDSPKPLGADLASTRRKPGVERLQSTSSSIGFSWLVKDDPDADGEMEDGQQGRHGRHDGARNSVKFDV